MSADLDKAHEALQNLIKNPQALDQLNANLESLRKSLGVEVNDSTFNYVLNTLLNQRVTDGQDKIGNLTNVTKLPHGFRILAAIDDPESK
jgi:hypothetical protein